MGTFFGGEPGVLFKNSDRAGILHQAMENMYSAVLLSLQSLEFSEANRGSLCV